MTAPTGPGGQGSVGGRLDGLTSAAADWSGLNVVVAGAGVSGFAAADALHERGARVIVVDGATAESSGPLAERVRILDILGVDVRLGPEHVAGLPTGMPGGSPDLVVTSPGWRPDQPLLVAAAQAGIPVWGEVELAWRMRQAVGPAPWLTVTGTNGKTTTVNMLASMLRAAGLRATAAGNVGTPILEAVLHPEPYDVIAVEFPAALVGLGRTARVRLPQRRPRPRGLARLLRGVRAGQGQGLCEHQGGLRLQRAGPRHGAAGHGR
jgi:UDP-N-acetylmuramoylalanine--D-glutamate ligase